MKKILSLLVLCVFTLCCHAQIYNKIEHFDKFDDVIFEENRKTLITQTDSTFIVEEKGKEPVVYHILTKFDNEAYGSKDNIVNLVGKVYGYDEVWLVIREDYYIQYLDDVNDYINHKTEVNPIDTLKSHCINIIHRTITTQYTGQYIREFLWLYDESNKDVLGKGVNRIIYSRE